MEICTTLLKCKQNSTSFFAFRDIKNFFLLNSKETLLVTFKHCELGGVEDDDDISQRFAFFSLENLSRS